MKPAHFGLLLSSIYNANALASMGSAGILIGVLIGAVFMVIPIATNIEDEKP